MESGISVGVLYAYQAGTFEEWHGAVCLYAGRYGNTRESVAVAERKIADTRHAGRYGDACQAGAAVERKIGDTRYAGRYGDAR